MHGFYSYSMEHPRKGEGNLGRERKRLQGGRKKMKEYYGVTMEWRSDIYSIRLSRVSLPRPGPPGVDMSGVVTCSLSINPPPSDCPYWEDDRGFVSEHTAMAEAFNVLVY